MTLTGFSWFFQCFSTTNCAFHSFRIRSVLLQYVWIQSTNMQVTCAMRCESFNRDLAFAQLLPAPESNLTHWIQSLTPQSDSTILLLCKKHVSSHLGLRLAIQNANLGGKKTDCTIRSKKPVCPKTKLSGRNNWAKWTSTNTVHCACKGIKQNLLPASTVLKAKCVDLLYWNPCLGKIITCLSTSCCKCNCKCTTRFLNLTIHHLQFFSLVSWLKVH